MSERVLASVRQIDAIHPIEGAESIECVKVDGWHVVVQKGDFTVNTLATYIEIDSWVPHTVAPFLSKDKTPSVYNGIPGVRLKTMKIRGQLSQGLLLHADPSWVLGQDVTDLLGIIKWEPYIPPEMAGLMKGDFPSFIPKTVQSRIQNITQNELEQFLTLKWEVTEKLDGSSMTVYINSDNELSVCSRNVELKFSEKNMFWKATLNQKLEAVLRDTCYGPMSIALQGEMIGEGIQKNPYKLSHKQTFPHKFYIFDIYDIKKGKYYTSSQRHAFIEKYKLLHVPILEKEVCLGTNDISQLKEITLKHAEGHSKLCAIEREGLVYKCTENPEYHFKAISNVFLCKRN